MIKFNNTGRITIIVLSLIALFALALIGGLVTQKENLSRSSGEMARLVNKASSGLKNTLQLDSPDVTLLPTTPISPTASLSPTPTSAITITTTLSPTRAVTPRPSGVINRETPEPTDLTTVPTVDPNKTYCPKDQPNNGSCECLPDERMFARCDDGRYCGYGDKDCDRSILNDPSCYPGCFYKPVIYLYPEKEMMVDVRLQIPGIIFKSDPLYPKEGWKNVKAYPDGKLIYNGKFYRELFYDSDVGDFKQPANGIIIPTLYLEERLKDILYRLGLSSFERQEFLTFWLPKLYKLDMPYILFSLIDSGEKTRIDAIIISPEPDTRIEFLAYFKGTKMPYSISPLLLPLNPPERKGFTMVEWGGTID